MDMEAHPFANWGLDGCWKNFRKHPKSLMQDNVTDFFYYYIGDILVHLGVIMFAFILRMQTLSCLYRRLLKMVATGRDHEPHSAEYTLRLIAHCWNREKYRMPFEPDAGTP